MDIIVSHTNTDFDGFASMLACTKLYPNGKMVFPGKLNKNLREFFSLHKDAFEVILPSKINPQEVKRLIVVDTVSQKRLGSIGPLLLNEKIEVIVYDHHPINDPLPNNIKAMIAEVGATITLLVEAIKERNIPITPFDASVFALGIYEDTGSLTYSTTTVRDVKAVAYLLERGAKLSLVSEYITKPLNQGQRELLDQLLENSKNIKINGWDILLTTGSMDEFIGGVGEITKKIGNLEGVDGIFTVVHMIDRVHVVARSLNEAMTVLPPIRSLGGGGHEKAASATIKGDDLEKIVHGLLEALKEIPSPMLAKDIMTRPVKTIHQDTKIEEANKLMLRYGHTGFPVVDKDILVGIISRRDVDKAIHHKLGHSPVKGVMSRNIVKIKENTSFMEIQKLLIEKDIGRLPVVDKHNAIVGIITRTDVLKLIHGDETPRWHKSLYNSEDYNLASVNGNLNNVINSRLPKKIQGLLLLIGQKAEKEGYKAYAIGGFARDLILGLQNFDIDIVVENNAIEFAEKLVKYLGGKLKTFPQFGTATLTLKDGNKIDFATARMEFYPFPAAMPEVEETTIKHDLYRRDFTINTLGFKLNSPVFGDFLDFFHGKVDLEKGIIRVLYNLSFVEDPTRILRAIRFESRYGFTIEEQTLGFLTNALENNMLAQVKPKRILEELKLILSEKNGLLSMNRCIELGILEGIFGEISNKKLLIKALEETKVNINLYNKKEIAVNNEFFVYLQVILSFCNEAKQKDFLTGLQLDKSQLEDFDFFFNNYKETIQTLKNPRYFSASEIVETLQGYKKESMIVLLALSFNSTVQKRILLYVKEFSNIDIEVTGEDLKKIGLQPGPVFSDIIKKLRKEKIDNNLSSKEEELLWVRSEYLSQGQKEDF